LSAWIGHIARIEVVFLLDDFPGVVDPEKIGNAQYGDRVGRVDFRLRDNSRQLLVKE
jgi:hypothetical protein